MTLEQQLAREEREHHRVAHAPVRVTQVRAKEALALEPDLLGNTLRRQVVRVGDELNTWQLELLERMSREESQCTSADAPATPRRSNPVTDARAVAAPAKPEADRTHHDPFERDRERVILGGRVSADERQGIGLGVRRGDQRCPVRDLRVVACFHERLHVVFPPRP